MARLVGLGIAGLVGLGLLVGLSSGVGVAGLVGLRCRLARLVGLGIAGLVGLRRWLARLVGVGVAGLVGLRRWLARLVGLGIAGLVGLLARLAEGCLVGVVELSSSSVGNELGLPLLPLVHDKHAHNAAHDGHGKRTDQAPDPHGSGVAVLLCRCALGGLVLPLDLMLVVVLEGDLGALDRAAVGLGDLTREGHRLRDLGDVLVADAVEIQRLNDVLVALVLDVLRGRGDGVGPLHRACAGAVLLHELHLEVFIRRILDSG